METRDLLRLLLELFGESHQTGASLSLYPVIVDDYGAHIDTLRVTTRALGASLVVASECSEGVPGQLDTPAQAHVEGHLNVPRAGATVSQVHLSQNTDMVVASIDGERTFGSQAQRELLGIAVSLFSDQLSGARSIVLLYDEDVLDDEWAAATWRLFSSLHGQHFLGVSRLVLVLKRAAGTTEDMHLESDTSVRYLLNETGMTQRKPRQVDHSQVHRIAASAQNDGLVLFLGAGFARSSGLPLGDALRDEALANFLGLPEASYRELAMQFRAHLQANSRLLESEGDMTLADFSDTITLERVLREEVWNNGADKSPTLRRFAELNQLALSNRGKSIELLHKLTERASRLVVVTVNFDTLIESNNDEIKAFITLDQFGDGPQYITDYLQQSEPHVPLLKLHGSIGATDTIVATVDQTAQGLAQEKEDSLRAILADRSNVPWIYVGYSMRDPDVWSALQSRAIADHTDEYWVSPFADSNARIWCDRHRKFGTENPTFWERCITLTADQFLEQLLAAWPT